jgi:hypothetical protein
MFCVREVNRHRVGKMPVWYKTAHIYRASSVGSVTRNAWRDVHLSIPKASDPRSSTMRDSLLDIRYPRSGRPYGIATTAQNRIGVPPHPQVKGTYHSESLAASTGSGRQEDF